MKRREAIPIDRALLLTRLASVERALVRGDTTAALQALRGVYQLIPTDPAPIAPRRQAKESRP